MRDCDLAMWSLDAPATQPVGDTSTRSRQIHTVRHGVKTGHRQQREFSGRFTELWQRNRLDDDDNDGPSSPGPTGSRYGER